jgi:hypothetical protein
VKCANAEADEENRNGCANTVADENSRTETASSNEQRKGVLQELRIEADPSRADDDNKENVSNAHQAVEEASSNSYSEDENRPLENNENVPLKVRELMVPKNAAFISSQDATNLTCFVGQMKVAKMQNKVHPQQAAKLKKTTTNPRPFRLRTDVSYFGLIILQDFTKLLTSFYSHCLFTNILLLYRKEEFRKKQNQKKGSPLPRKTPW